MIVRVKWTDAVGCWPQVWTSLDEIMKELESTEVITVGHLIEGHGQPYVVVAASQSGDTWGGIFAIPQHMVTSTETIEPDARQEP